MTNQKTVSTERIFYCLCAVLSAGLDRQMLLLCFLTFFGFGLAIVFIICCFIFGFVILLLELRFVLHFLANITFPEFTCLVWKCEIKDKMKD